jgi:FkbM family methyltransferase
MFEGVAADRTGTLSFAINPDHPGDHRIAVAGVEVAANTLDHLLSGKNWPTVSFIMIDVQGAELAVLKGARTLLRRCKPVLYVEVDPDALNNQGASVEQLLQ